MEISWLTEDRTSVIKPHKSTKGPKDNTNLVKLFISIPITSPECLKV